ncbi:MAG: hypothetical protein ACK4UN_11670, partial [Limisphaerales bacterium]
IQFHDFGVTAWGFHLSPPVYICWGLFVLILRTRHAPRLGKRRGLFWRGPTRSVFVSRDEEPVAYWAGCFLMALIAFAVTVAINPVLAGWLEAIMIRLAG